MLQLNAQRYPLHGRVLPPPYGIGLLLVALLGVPGVAFVLVQLGLAKGIDFPKFSALAFLFVLAVLGVAIVGRRLSALRTPFYLACLFYVTFVGIGPLLVPPNFEDPAQAGSNWPIVASWLGMTAMMLGYVSGKVAFRSSKANLFPGVRDSLIPLEKLGFVGWGLVALGITGAALYVERIGGLAALQSAGYYKRPSMLWYDAALAILMKPGLFLLLGATMAKPRVFVGKRLLLFALTLGALAWEGPLAGSRLHVITLVLALGCLLRLGQGAQRKKAPLFPYRWLVLTGLSFVLVWGALRAYSITKLREMSFSQLDRAATSQSSFFVSAFSTYDAFVKIVQRVPDSIPYQWGETIWESLTVWIPREFWPNKPMGLGDRLTITLSGEYGVGNTSPTGPGELYLNFGLLGLLIGMLLVGVGCAWLSQGVSGRPSQDMTASLLLYAVTFPLPLALTWGGSDQVVWNLADSTLPIYAVLLVARFLHAFDTAPLATRFRPRTDFDRVNSRVAWSGGSKPHAREGIAPR